MAGWELDAVASCVNCALHSRRLGPVSVCAGHSEPQTALFPVALQCAPRPPAVGAVADAEPAGAPGGPVLGPQGIRQHRHSQRRRLRVRVGCPGEASNGAAAQRSSRLLHMQVHQRPCNRYKPTWMAGCLVCLSHRRWGWSAGWRCRMVCLRSAWQRPQSCCCLAGQTASSSATAGCQRGRSSNAALQCSTSPTRMCARTQQVSLLYS